MTKNWAEYYRGLTLALLGGEVHRVRAAGAYPSPARRGQSRHADRQAIERSIQPRANRASQWRAAFPGFALF